MNTNKKFPGFLTESCLLTFGLPSVGNDELMREWKASGVDGMCICWVEKGDIAVGSIEEFLRFRAGAPKFKFSSDSLDRALCEKLSGALTASATMEVCRRMGVACAVSCGIGGIEGEGGRAPCADLRMIKNSGVALICTSPKDMLNIEATVGWLRQNGVSVLGCGSGFCTGYIFNGKPVALDGLWRGERSAPLAILRPIAAKRRLHAAETLKLAVSEAKEAESRGGYFHPAANAALDRLSKGYSSRLQLSSFLDNVVFAAGFAAEAD